MERKLMDEMFGDLIDEIQEKRYKQAKKFVDEMNDNKDGRKLLSSVGSYIVRKDKSMRKPEVAWFLCVIKDALPDDEKNKTCNIQLPDRLTTILFIDLFKKYAKKLMK